MQVTWCKVYYLRRMWGTEWSITYHGKDVRLVSSDLRCEDVHCHVRTPHLQCETQSIFSDTHSCCGVPQYELEFNVVPFCWMQQNISLATKFVSITSAAVVLLDHSVCGGCWCIFIFWILWSVVLCHRTGEHLAKCCWRSEGCKLSVNLWLIINILGKKYIETLMDQSLSWMMVCVFPVSGITSCKSSQIFTRLEKQLCQLIHVIGWSLTFDTFTGTVPSFLEFCPLH